MSGLPGNAWKDPLLLCPCVRTKYEQLIERANREFGISVATIETARDYARQKHYKKVGVSKTLNSYHLVGPAFVDGKFSFPGRKLALAFDVVPRAYLTMKHWHPGGELYKRLAEIARDLDLECGADFSGFNEGWDWPHYQQRVCECP